MQNLISLSSAQAELYELVKASSEALGCQSVAKDMGQEGTIRVYADARRGARNCAQERTRKSPAHRHKHVVGPAGRVYEDH